MCNCQPGFVCLRCIGTPFDDNYDEGRTVTEREPVYAERGEGE